MNARVFLVLRCIGLLALPVLIAGCTPDATSGPAMVQDVSAFLGDFARQILTALLL